MSDNIERFTGKRAKATMHDVEELRNVVREFLEVESPVSFAAAIITEDGKFKTRFVLLPSSNGCELFTLVNILEKDILEIIEHK